MKDFVYQLAQGQRIKRTDLVEKDVIIHGLLNALSKQPLLGDRLVFKGGTCLIKAYLGYFRFSEDVDFTWSDQSAFDQPTGKASRRYLSDLIDRVGRAVEDASRSVSLDFRCEKNDRHFVELGGSDKMVTFKLWYDSDIMERESFLKLQINFRERILHPVEYRELANLIREPKGDVETLFPAEYAAYSAPVMMHVYCIREILCEKVRAILTRKGTKARDFIDVYWMVKRFNLDVEELRPDIIDKTQFTLKMYRKYRDQLRERQASIESDFVFSWEAEKGLMLIDVDDADFQRFLETFLVFVRDIAMELEISD